MINPDPSQAPVPGQSRPFNATGPRKPGRRSGFSRLAAGLLILCLVELAAAQTITVVGTAHLTGLEQAPSPAQFAHTINALSEFKPTQVCVERMSGERIEMLLANPARHGASFHDTWHGRPLATSIVPLGLTQQLLLERRPADARAEADELLARWDDLALAERVRAIRLQLAGYEFHSAVLNWSWLDEAQRQRAGERLGVDAVQALNRALTSVHEVYSLGVPLARKAGLHELCTADSQEDETAGIEAALEHGGQAVLEHPDFRSSTAELARHTKAAWQPDAGPGALTAMLRFFNGEEYTALDRKLQWEPLLELDNEAGAFQRRLMYWHARTAEISAELFRALARGTDERVMLIIGSAHRPFTEADLRAQPWFNVYSASALLAEQEAPSQ